MKKLQKKIKVFDIPNQKYIGQIDIETVNDKYDRWRASGHGVLIDRDGCICIDDEEPDDDGKYYSEQIEELKKLN